MDVEFPQLLARDDHWTLRSGEHRSNGGSFNPGRPMPKPQPQARPATQPATGQPNTGQPNTGQPTAGQPAQDISIRIDAPFAAVDRFLADPLNWPLRAAGLGRSDEHTSEIQSLMSISYS